MTTEIRPMSQNSIVRHYRAPTRSETELAYRADALKAARTGYVAVDQAWTEDEQGFLLAVTYAGPDAYGPAAKGMAPSEPAEHSVAEVQPLAAVAAQPEVAAEPVSPQRTYQPVRRIPQVPATEPPPPANSEQNGSVQGTDTPHAVTDTPHAAIDAPAEQAATQPAPRETVVEPAPEPVPEEIATVAEPVEVDEAPDASATTEPEPLGRQPKLTIQTMELHTAGEPLRLIRSGFPDVPMLPVLERRQWVKENADHVRRSLMFEPRGHKDMYGAVLLPPHSDFADMTVLFMHNEGWSTMCGHGVIAITTGLIEDGLFPATEPVTTIRFETPAGIVAANAATVKLEDGSWAVRGVRFTNVPSYLAAQSLSVRPDGVELHGMAKQYGALGVDLAFGGAYYGIVNAAEVGLRVVPEQADELRRVGSAITDVLRRDHTPAHPSDPDLSFVYGTIIVDLEPRTSPDGKARDAHIRNVTIFADAELDRSPCGSGTSAILAQLHARGRIQVGQEIINAGITAEHFLGRVESETTLGPHAAVNTSVAGTAYVTGYSTFVVDGRDPLAEGFLLE
ncbi:MAG TPA: proline racemase family protein [Candidatus Limnocylindrales bacterium]